MPKTSVTLAAVIDVRSGFAWRRGRRTLGRRQGCRCGRDQRRARRRQQGAHDQAPGSRTAQLMVRVEHFDERPRARRPRVSLAHAPYANVFLTYLILFDLRPQPSTRSTRARRSRHDQRHCVLCAADRLAAQDPAAIEAFARIGLAHHGEKMIVGPRTETAAYWSQVRHKHERPRVIRDRQFVMMIDRSQMLPYDRNVVARRARIDEWPSVADNSA